MFPQVKWSAEQLMSNPIQFGDFLDASEGSERRVYKLINDRPRLIQTLEELHMRQHMGNARVRELRDSLYTLPVTLYSEPSISGHSL